MKVCLVYPECYDIAKFGVTRKEFPPFGVMYLASSLEKEGVSVTIVPTSNQYNQFDFRNFDLVGYSISSSASYPLIKNTHLNSQYKSSQIVMAGGIHASLYPKEVLEELNLDIVAIGEGENTICDIVHHLKDYDFSKVKGIYYKKEGQVFQNELREIIEDLDTIPFPARHLLPSKNILMRRLAGTDLLIAHVLFTRGCPYYCNFCANQNHDIRYRSKENIIEELKMLIDVYGIRGFCVTDDNFLIDKRRVLPIVREIEKLNLKWSTLSRVDNIDLELLQALRESGCIEIKYGIESGSQAILDSMNKKITVEEAKRALQLTSQVGIQAKALIMHGYPGENMQTTQETIRFLEESKEYISRVGLTYFTYLPGSPIYPKEGYHGNYGVYCENQVTWGDEEEQQEVLASRKVLTKYINSNFTI